MTSDEPLLSSSPSSSTSKAEALPDLRSLHHQLHVLLRRHRLASFSHALLRDVVFVATGARRAALLDFALPDDAVDASLAACHAADPALFAPLRCLCIPDASSASPATFLISRTAFLRADPLCSPPIVDVDPSLASPQPLPASLYSASIDRLQLFTTQLSIALSPPTSSSLRITLPPPPSLPLPTVCGFLLAYPVLYSLSSACCSASAPLPTTNCLSSQPLLLHSLSIHPSDKLRSLSPSFALPTYPLLSYTHPLHMPDPPPAPPSPTLHPALFSHLTHHTSAICELRLSL